MLKIENNQIVRYVPLKVEIKTLTDSPCMMLPIRDTGNGHGKKGMRLINLDLKELNQDQLAVLIGKAKREFDRR